MDGSIVATPLTNDSSRQRERAQGFVAPSLGLGDSPHAGYCQHVQEHRRPHKRFHKQLRVFQFTCFYVDEYHISEALEPNKLSNQKRQKKCFCFRRKAAMQLVRKLVEFHPYGPALKGSGDERAKAEKLLNEIQEQTAPATKIDIVFVTKKQPRFHPKKPRFASSPQERLKKLKAEELAELEGAEAGDAAEGDAEAAEPAEKRRRCKGKTESPAGGFFMVSLRRVEGAIGLSNQFSFEKKILSGFSLPKRGSANLET